MERDLIWILHVARQAEQAQFAKYYFGNRQDTGVSDMRKDLNLLMAGFQDVSQSELLD